MTIDRRDRVALVVVLLLAGTCVRLGFWQLDRLHQRRARNAVVAAARARPELELSGSVPLDSVRDRRLRARGVYDYAYERLWRGRSYEGIPGVDLITPLRLADGTAVLVDRGWVPSPDAYHVDERLYREGDSAEVAGFGLEAPRGRGDVDPATLDDSLPYRVARFVLEQLPTAHPPIGPSALRRWTPAELTNGPHLSYAIQWFSFATIIVVGSFVLLRQRATVGGTANAR